MISSTDVNSIWNHPEFRKTSLFEEFSQRPLGFVDIGARGGVHPLVEPMAGGVAVMAFEPDPQAYEDLKTLPRGPWADVDLEMVALGEKKGKSELCLISSPTNNSLREPDTHFTSRYPMPKWALTGKIEVELDTMDNVFFSDRRRHQVHWGEFMKIDTQGTEYEILQGGRKTLLERSVMVVAELEFFKIYQDQKLFSDVEIFMRELGFSFYGFNNMFYRSRRTFPAQLEQKERWFYGDAVFVRDPFDRPNSTFTQRQIKALCASALLNGFIDLAFEVAEKLLPKDAPYIRNMMTTMTVKPTRLAEQEVCRPI